MRTALVTERSHPAVDGATTTLEQDEEHCREAISARPAGAPGTLVTARGTAR